MTVIDLAIKDIKLFIPKIFRDARGWFCESYSEKVFNADGFFYSFIQDNHSFSEKKGTLRGLHYQAEPKAQTKLVRCTKGSVFDVAVDLRRGSPTYKKWVGEILSQENFKQLLIPKGFAHGFLTLTDDTEVQYKVDNFYSPEHERSICFDDPEFSIDWGIEKPLLSDKDRNALLFVNCGCDF